MDNLSYWKMEETDDWHGFKDDNERLALLLDMYSKKVSENNER